MAEDIVGACNEAHAKLCFSILFYDKGPPRAAIRMEETERS